MIIGDLTIQIRLSVSPSTRSKRRVEVKRRYLQTLIAGLADELGWWDNGAERVTMWTHEFNGYETVWALVDVTPETFRKLTALSLRAKEVLRVDDDGGGIEIVVVAASTSRLYSADVTYVSDFWGADKCAWLDKYPNSPTLKDCLRRALATYHGIDLDMIDSGDVRVRKHGEQWVVVTPQTGLTDWELAYDDGSKIEVVDHNDPSEVAFYLD